MLTYTVLMLVLDAAGLIFLAQGRRASRGVGMVLALLAAGTALAILRGGLRFYGLGLFATTVFIHVPLVLLGSTLVLWRTRRGTALLALLVALAVLGAGVDAFFIEPFRLRVRRVGLTSAKLDKPVRIVVVSDLQAEELGDHERRALELAMAEQPDLLLLPGDYLSVPFGHRLSAAQAELRNLLRELRFGAPLGTYAVRGNCEEAGWERVFDGLPIQAPSHRGTFRSGPVAVTCLDLVDSFDAGITVEPEDEFHIVVGHSPNFALGDVQADLLVAGHTHGGQVHLPFFGPPITLSKVPRAWACGTTTLAPALDGSPRTLDVSAGIGMERSLAPQLRFLCPPEIVVIDVAPAD